MKLKSYLINFLINSSTKNLNMIQYIEFIDYL